MKKLLIVLTITILTSCTSLEKISFIPGEENLYGIDFKRYSDEGFLVTPEKYLGEYESIGLLTYELVPSSNYRRTGRQPNPNYVHGSTSSGPQFYDIYKWVDEKMDTQQALDSLYNICVKNGANGLMNFRTEEITRAYLGVENPHTVIGIRLSGFAIKINP
ncbi:MAG: hypothetical protein DRI89_00265 [Bacteroidetes bacterium]|nr:MAG: hypothetical protein DRI89_00265 [Bacteroidota bacterium]